jgi:predicted nucleotidyltransferase
MEALIAIMAPFFEEPSREYHIRELSRLLKINHTTIRQRVNRLVREGYLRKVDRPIYPAYKSEITKKFLNLKLYYNLEKIRTSLLIEHLEKYFDYPVIVLFGSYSTANDGTASDIDIAVITDITKESSLAKYEKSLKRSISLHVFSKSKWQEMAKTNKPMMNSICNGIVLSGQLEVV